MRTQEKHQLLLHPGKVPPDSSATIRRLARRQSDQYGPMSLSHHLQIPIDRVRRGEKDAEPALHTAPDVMQDVVAGYLEYRVVESVIQVIEFLDRVAACGVLHPLHQRLQSRQVIRPEAWKRQGDRELLQSSSQARRFPE